MAYKYEASTNSILRDDNSTAIQFDQHENARLHKILKTGRPFNYDEARKLVSFSWNPLIISVEDTPDIEGQLVTQLGWTQQRATNFVKIIRKIVSQEMSR